MRALLWFFFLFAFAFPAQAERVFRLAADGKFDEAILEAKAKKDPLLLAFAQWSSLKDTRAPTPIPFQDGYRFLSKHAGWPDEKIIRLRTEEAALNEAVDANTLRQFCARFPPISGRGMIACATVGTTAQRQEWIAQGWKQGDFSESEERAILQRHGSALTLTDHHARMERLLFEEKPAAAKRLLDYLPRERRTLYLARIALTSDAQDATSRLNTVPVHLQRDSGLLFARILWRAKRSDWTGVSELLLRAPDNPPFADAWWKYRARAARYALEHDNAKEALNILNKHGTLSGEALADALFLKGWIALTHQRDAHRAYRDFYTLYNAVNTPISKARAAYWSAQAARHNGNTEITRQWLEKAAARPVTFYGQLAHASLYPNTPLALPTAPLPTKAETESFAKEQLVRLIRVLGRADEKELSQRFLLHLARETESPSRLVLVANLARTVGDKTGGIRVAKQALRKGVVLLEEGWPRRALPEDIPIEPALALAITRQESEFDPRAKSPANAMGLMQLLPSTAREVARKHGFTFTPSDLLNPTRNIALGTRYLRQLIDARNGSYILAIAAYNAGLGNVAEWRETYGEPRATVDSAVQWIEQIPFAETRNYVMRVIENLQIYRQQNNPTAPLVITEDLTRGHSPLMQDGPTVAP